MFVCPICRRVLPDDGECSDHGADALEVADHSIPLDLSRRYDVATVYGGGDTGALYRAVERETGVSGVLKVMTLSAGASDAGRDRLLRQLERQCTLSASPHFRHPRAAGVEQDIAWFFREWVDGESLKSRLFRDGQLALGDAVAVVMQVAEALDQLHCAGLVHRAVRPNHVLLRPHQSGAPEVVLIDAGIVGDAERGSPFDDLGDLLYMSPEQTKARPLSFRSDLYSLGCVFFDALTGAPPFDGDDATAVMTAHQYQIAEVPKDMLPSAVAELLSRMLAKHPSDRPLSTREVLTELKPYAAEVDSLPRQSSFPPARRSSAPPARNSSVPPAASADPVPLVRRRPESARPSAPSPAVALGAVARAAAKSSPPPAIALSAVASSPPPAVALSAVRQSNPPPAVSLRSVPVSEPAPAPQSAPPAASLHAVQDRETPEEEHAPLPLRRKRRDPSSIRLALSDIKMPDDEAIPPVVAAKPRRRLPWLLVGFVLGCLSSAGAVYGMAMYGQFHLIPTSMEAYLDVPASRFESVSTVAAIPEEPIEEEEEVEPEPAVEEVTVDEAGADEAEGDEEAASEDETEDGETEEGVDPAETSEDGAEEAEASDAEEPEAEPTAEEPETLTPAQRRAQIRDERRERRRARVRARNIARIREQRAEMRAAAVGGMQAAAPPDRDLLDDLAL